VNKILIYGFPHSGTSILKRLICNSDEVYEIIEETYFIPENIETDKDNILIKYAGGKRLSYDFYYKEYKDYKIILVIKNPFDAIASLLKRFKKLNFSGYSVPDWEYYTNLFLFFRQNPVTNIFTIKYKEIFENDFKKIEELFLFLNLKYDKDKIIYNNRPAYISNDKYIPSEKPSRLNRYHVNFRTWQINQPLRNTTGESAKSLPKHLRKLLNNLKITKDLNYGN
jgi:hypothetical protein